MDWLRPSLLIYGGARSAAALGVEDRLGLGDGIAVLGLDAQSGRSGA